MPTREGLTVVVLAVAVFLLATNLMAGLLFVLEALLLSLFVVGVAATLLPMHRMLVRRQVPARGAEGSPIPIQVEVSSPRGGRFLIVEDGVPGMRARGLLAHLPSGRAVTVVVQPVPRTRGHFALGPVEVISRGAVGLFVARRRFDLADRITVWPQTAAIPEAVRMRLLGGSDGLPAGVRTRQSEDFYGVRDYQAGDHPNRIHWRSSARRGSLVVREYERPTRLSPAVVVDLDHRQSADRLNAVVRAAASLLRVMLEQWPDVVTLGWAPLPVEQRGWEATMDWLAGVEPSGPPVWDVLSGPGPYHDRPLIIVASTAGEHTRARGAAADTVVVLPAEDAPSGWPLVYTADGRVQVWQAGAA